MKVQIHFSSQKKEFIQIFNLKNNDGLLANHIVLVEISQYALSAIQYEVLLGKSN
jgi:hypothetical protein